MSRRRRRSASSSEKSDGSERSLSNDRYARREDSSDDEGSEDEIPDYLSGGSSDEENEQNKQMLRDEKDKEAEGIIEYPEYPFSKRESVLLLELAIKVALEEFMEKIKQSGALFHSNNDPQPSQTSLCSFTDLSAHLFAAFASNDCASPLFADQNSAADDPYSLPLYSHDQPFRSILIGKREINVPPGSVLLLCTGINNQRVVGFEQDSDALAAAEIEQKLAEFELEPIMDNAITDQQEQLDNDQ